MYWSSKTTITVTALLLCCISACSTVASAQAYDSSTSTNNGDVITHHEVIVEEGKPETTVDESSHEITTTTTTEDQDGTHSDYDYKHSDVMSGPLKLRHCSQSSTTYKGVCSRAIDGNVNQNYGKHSCTHTKAEKGWWQAKTTGRAYIRQIRIYNRLDCCSGRLRNFVVTVDGHVCAQYNSKAIFSVKTFNCYRAGRVIRIKNMARTPLTLCEVQVFGDLLGNHYMPDHKKGPLKLRHCSQSSTTYKGVCRRAIDGNVNQNYWKHSCSHTKAEKGWWQAKTSGRAYIRQIRIYNRLDCCSGRLRNFVVTVDGHVCAQYNSKAIFSVKTFNCNRAGRVIRIKNMARTILTLCEVQVFGRLISN